jgi:hypothetical protein
MGKVLVSSRKRIIVPSPRPAAVREIQLIDRVEAWSPEVKMHG